MLGENSRQKWDLSWKLKGENYSGKEARWELRLRVRRSIAMELIT